MTRAQCLVCRDNRILMVKHRLQGEEWWCLPGGGVEAGEAPDQAALRELQEECNLEGKIIRQTGRMLDADGTETVTFLIEAGSQQPRMGADPEFGQAEQILVDMQWLSLAEISERDRAYLWAAGLLTLPLFLGEAAAWGDALSYPGE
jgi:8-oxo-dGTP diphosphatase